MNIILNIIFFTIGFILRDKLTYIYNINKKIKQADEILERERKRIKVNMIFQRIIQRKKNKI